MSNKAERLIKLAQDAFNNLSDPEYKLLQKVADGEEADYKTYDNEPVLRASLIAWLCTDTDAYKLVTLRGLNISRAVIKECLDLNFSTLEFPLIFAYCHFMKGINLSQAKLKFLDLSGSQIFSDTERALDLANTEIEGRILLGLGFKACGKVVLYNARLGSLECDGGVFENPEGTAIQAEGIEVRGSAFLRQKEIESTGEIYEFESTGEVTFSGAIIGGSLSCEGGNFSSSEGAALNLQNAQIAEDVDLHSGFSAVGTVWMYGISISGSLNCTSGTFKGREALAVDNAQIKGDFLLLNGFEATGEVSLSGAKIDGTLDCSSGCFYASQSNSLVVGNSTILGNVYLSDDFYATGIVKFVGSTIANTFEFKTNRYLNNMALILSFADIRTLSDSESSWPLAGRLLIDGLTYKEIHANSPSDYKSRLKWIRLQRREGYSFQPYTQLAKVMKESGLEEEATEILIARQRDRRSYSKLDWFGQTGNWILDLTIAYGYRTYRVLFFSFIFVILGGFFFWIGNLESPQLLSPSKVHPFNNSSSEELSEYYPIFNPIIYSLDTFVPVVNLHQQDYWLPNANRERLVDVWPPPPIWSPSRGECVQIFPFKLKPKLKGAYLRWYMWFHIVAGWFFTSLGVAGLTGLVRRIN